MKVKGSTSILMLAVSLRGKYTVIISYSLASDTLEGLSQYVYHFNIKYPPWAHILTTYYIIGGSLLGSSGNDRWDLTG